MRKIKICGIFAALLSLFSCNDKIDVQQAYDFGITTDQTGPTRRNTVLSDP